MGILDDLFASGNASGTGAAAPAASIGQTLLQSFGSEMIGASHLAQGEAQNQADIFQAQQLRQNAGQAMAGAERTDVDVQRQVNLISSRALAVAAANGGGASSPSAITNISRIAGEGAYRQSLALYAGQQQSQHDTLQAEGDEFSGKMAVNNAKSIYDASQVNTAATLMKGGSSLFSKYGAGGPSTNTNNGAAIDTSNSSANGNYWMSE